MQQAWTSLFLLAGVWTMSHGEVPVGQCKDPMPSLEGFEISDMVGVEYEYIYTPNQKIYHYVDHINLKLKELTPTKIYEEKIDARTPYGVGSQKWKFLTEYLGNGVLKRTKGDNEYFVSIVSVVDTMALMYVCSTNAADENVTDDTLYVLARTSANVKTEQDPTVIFSEAFDKYDFNGSFYKLPRKHLSKKHSKH